MTNLDEILSSLEKAWQDEKTLCSTENIAKINDDKFIEEKKALDEVNKKNNQVGNSQQGFDKSKTTIDNEIFSYRKSKSSAEKIELEGRRDFFRLRKLWSICIIFWITIFIAFHGGIALAVGFGHLNYENHQSILLTILAEDFLQILGMGYVIVKFLYPVNAVLKK